MGCLNDSLSVTGPATQLVALKVKNYVPAPLLNSDTATTKRDTTMPTLAPSTPLSPPPFPSTLPPARYYHAGLTFSDGFSDQLPGTVQ